MSPSIGNKQMASSTASARLLIACLTILLQQLQIGATLLSIAPYFLKFYSTSIMSSSYRARAHEAFKSTSGRNIYLVLGTDGTLYKLEASQSNSSGTVTVNWMVSKTYALCSL